MEISERLTVVDELTQACVNSMGRIGAAVLVAQECRAECILVRPFATGVIESGRVMRRSPLTVGNGRQAQRIVCGFSGLESTSGALAARV